MYSRNQFFVHAHPSSTMHLIFLSPSMFSHDRGWSKPDCSLCSLWIGDNPVLAAIFLWSLSAPPPTTRHWSLMWCGTELWAFWQGSQKRKQFPGNFNCSTLKTSDWAISGFKFPATTAWWTSAVFKQLQLRRYHWRLVSSLRQIFCAQRAAGMTPVLKIRVFSNKTVKVPDTWLPRAFPSYLIIDNLWGQCLRVCFNITIFLIEEKYGSST